MDEKTPPFFEISEVDHGGVAVVAALCTIIISSMVSVIRYFVATRQRVEFAPDDATFYLACFLANASSICVYRAVLSGLGRHIDSLTTQDLGSYYKLMYTAQLFSILSMTSSKISVVMLMKRITQVAKRSYKFGLGMVLLWGLFSFLAVSFQCQLPKPWVFVPSQCSSHGNIQYPIIIFNVITDGILGIAILPTIWKLKVAKATRVTILILFGMRLLVSTMAIGELVSVANSIRNIDQTWVNLARSVWLLLVTHVSVITATIPRTHSFWASIVSGKANTAITEQEYELSGGHQSPLNSRISSKNRFAKFSKSSKKNNSDLDEDRSGNWPSTRLRGGKQNQSRSHIGGESLHHSTSEEPLQLVPKPRVDLQTRVYSEEAGNDAAMGGREDDDTSQTNLRLHGPGDFEVWREREVVVQVDYIGKP